MATNLLNKTKVTNADLNYPINQISSSNADLNYPINKISSSSGQSDSGSSSSTGSGSGSASSSTTGGGIYSYADFEKAYQESGVYFSEADLALAKANPDVGMSLLSHKLDYANATTDEARALAHAGAEGDRSSWGGYTGGTDGSGFYKNDMSYRDFNYGDAPTAPSSSPSDLTNSLTDQVMNYGSFSSSLEKPTYTSTAGSKPVYSSSAVKPTYSGQYVDDVDTQLNNVLNYGDFSYDPTTDELYSAYRKQYAREGQRATAEALAAAAAASGGMPSSYAVTAAGQAGDYYASQLTDKIPELYQIAYQKYLNDYSMAESKLGAAQSVEQQDYNKYLNELNQYNTDRNFDLSMYQTDLGQYNTDRNFDLSMYQTNLGQYNTDRSFDYQSYLDGYNMLANNLSIAQSQDDTQWNRYLAMLDQYNTDRAFAYGQHSDEVAQQNYLKELQNSQEQSDREWQYNLANLGANYSDYNGLNMLGIDTTRYQTDQNYQTAMNQAMQMAQYGDYSGLAAMGVDISNIPTEFEKQLAIAEIWADLGNTSYLAALGGGGTPTTISSGGSSGSSGSSGSGSGSGSGTATSSGSGNSTITLLKNMFPSGKVSSSSQWTNLCAIYGKDTLAAAGISYGA